MSDIYLQIESKRPSSTSKSDDIRDAAKEALSQLLEPLAGFIFDCGLSVHEVNSIFRLTAVQNTAKRQLLASGRISISGIAAATGIGRAEVSRALKLKTKPPRGARSRQQATNKILKIWHEDPRYTDAAGQPAVLKVFGRSVTFEGLVKSYGGGIPIRALLDELVRTGAVELLPDQRIRARSELAVDRGINARAVKVFGDTGGQLLATMLENMRDPNSQRFVASVFENSVPNTALPLFRKDLSRRGAGLLSEIQEHLNDVRNRSRRKSRGTTNVSVTMFSYESAPTPKVHNEAKKRRNFHRARN